MALSWHHYIGRRARLAYFAHYGYWVLGGYRRYRRVRWAQVQRLVFVCRGNICRSAYAEHWAKVRGLSAASVGVDTTRGRPANATALKVARDRNVALDEHRTTTLEDFDAKDGDLFIAMEPSHAAVIERSPNWTSAHQVTLLGLWIDAQGPAVSDPFGQDEVTFEGCFSLIEAGVLAVKGRLPQDAHGDGT